MVQIQSESQKQEHKSRRFFIPSFSELILYLLLGGVFLALFNSSKIIGWLNTDYIGSPQDLNSSLGILNNSISTSLSTAFGGRLGQIIVWSFIGAIAYIILWFLKNILNSFENDVIIDHYLHPSNFNRAGYWGSALAGKIFFGVALILVIIYTYLILRLIFPAASTLSVSALYHFELSSSILYISLCVLMAAASIYVWARLVRILGHLWKLL